MALSRREILQRITVATASAVATGAALQRPEWRRKSIRLRPRPQSRCYMTIRAASVASPAWRLAWKKTRHSRMLRFSDFITPTSN